MHKRIFKYGIIAAVLLYQIWVLYLTVQYSFSGLRVVPADDGRWSLTSVDTTSVANHLEVSIGDTITAINGSDPGNYWSVRRFGSIDQAETITVQRLDGEEVLKATLPFRLQEYDIFSLLTEFFSLSLAVWLHRKAKHTPSSRFLVLLFLNIAFIFMSICASVRGDPLGKMMLLSSMMLIPASFFHFLAAFLEERGNYQLKARFLKPLYMVIGLSLASMLVFFINTPITYPVFRFMKTAVLLVCFIGACANLGLLLHLLIKSKKRNDHLAVIVKTVFLSLLGALSPLVFLSLGPKLVFGDAWIDPMHASWFLFLIPLTFVYLLVTPRLYDIDIILRRFFLTTVIALVPSVLFTAALPLFFPTEATWERLISVLFILIAGISFVLYVLEYLTTRLEPTLFPRKHRLQAALKKIARNLGTISSFRQLKEIILVDIVKALEVAGGAIVFKYDQHLETISEGGISIAEVEALVESGNMESSVYICIEISRQEEYTSYLVITQKKSTTMLGMEEIQWLNLIITYLAVSLENMQLIRKLDHKLQALSSLLPDEEEAENLIWFRKLMFELQEKERTRIATDLHDTTMQDLFFLKGRLHSLQGKYAYSAEDQSVLTSLLDYIDIINTNLRQSCFELHPHLIKEIGLISTLDKLISTERILSPFRLELHASDHHLIEQQSLDMKRHLFRLAQELINNAKKHSEASVVSLHLYARQDTVHFEYVDDGVGFEPGRAAGMEIGSSGIGVEQMKSRILSMGGRYELDTGKGKGMRLYAKLPIREGRTA